MQPAAMFLREPRTDKPTCFDFRTMVGKNKEKLSGRFSISSTDLCPLRNGLRLQLVAICIFATRWKHILHTYLSVMSVWNYLLVMSVISIFIHPHMFDTVSWLCVLVVCLGCVSWVCVLVVCLGCVSWLCVLVVCLECVSCVWVLVVCLGCGVTVSVVAVETHCAAIVCVTSWRGSLIWVRPFVRCLDPNDRVHCGAHRALKDLHVHLKGFIMSACSWKKGFVMGKKCIYITNVCVCICIYIYIYNKINKKIYIYYKLNI